MPEARARGYSPGRFSFNVRGGRCEACQGDGLIKVEMHFLPDVYVPCDVCHGKRYNRETLEILYKGFSIHDVLDMTVEDALKLFEPVPSIARKLETLLDVGLSYVKLGQPATTLSGGEAQRVKLSKELSRRDTGRTLYILDEPTTGLHFHDIEHLLAVLHKLRNDGNTIVVIEHNLDVIKTADWVIDLGPEGGHRGGQIIAPGHAGGRSRACRIRWTGQFLAKTLGVERNPQDGSRPHERREAGDTTAPPQAGEPRGSAKKKSQAANDAASQHAASATPPVDLIRVPLSVRWRDLDAFNHVNNSKFLSYLEEARLRWMMALPGEWIDEQRRAGRCGGARELPPADRMAERDRGRVVRRTPRQHQPDDRPSHRHRDDASACCYADGNVVMVWIDKQRRPSRGIARCRAQWPARRLTGDAPQLSGRRSHHAKSAGHPRPSCRREVDRDLSPAFNGAVGCISIRCSPPGCRRRRIVAAIGNCRHRAHAADAIYDACLDAATHRRTPGCSRPRSPRQPDTVVDAADSRRASASPFRRAPGASSRREPRQAIAPRTRCRRRASNNRTASVGFESDGFIATMIPARAVPFDCPASRSEPWKRSWSGSS